MLKNVKLLLHCAKSSRHNGNEILYLSMAMLLELAVRY